MNHKPHIEAARKSWREFVKPGDRIIDATCGNGHDTLFLAELVGNSGLVYAIDMQEIAIANTRYKIEQDLPELIHNVQFVHGCHSNFPKEIEKNSVQLIVYNLGYLPGGNKTITTLSCPTLKSVENALTLICPGGLITITCYPGHPEGKEELDALLTFTKNLDSKLWQCCHLNWINREHSPCLFQIVKV